jgi:EmrB/QacA subfamily drug resistance transporter
MANGDVPVRAADLARAGTDEPARRRRNAWVLAAAVLGSTMAFVDQSVVNIAVPRIEVDLHTSLSAMQWVINAYTLCMSSLLLIGGAAADQFGRRRMFVIGVTAFALASVGCGVAGTVSLLISARAAQGIAAALLVPCSLALIGATFEEKERGAAIGVWAGASAIAAGVAPLLGGWLVDHASWRIVFLINPLVAIPTLWITLTTVPESRDLDVPHGLDWPGALLAFTGLGCVVYALISSSHADAGHSRILVTLLAGLVLLTSFVIVERHSRSPMMPLELFRSRIFSGVNLLTLLLYGALGGAFFFLPFLLMQARGFSATATGAAYLPFTLILGALSRWSGGLLDRFGARSPLIIGPTITALGFICLGSVARAYWVTLGSMSVLGLGMAVTVAPLTTTVLNAVPGHRTGVASGINNAVASVGGLLMIAVLGSLALVLFNRVLDQHLTRAHAPQSIVRTVASARGAFVLPSAPAGTSRQEEQQARAIVVDSLTTTVRCVFWIAAGFALLSAMSAAFTFPRSREAQAPRTPLEKPP